MADSKRLDECRNHWAVRQKSDSAFRQLSRCLDYHPSGHRTVGENRNPVAHVEVDNRAPAAETTTFRDIDKTGSIKEAIRNHVGPRSGEMRTSNSRRFVGRYLANVYPKL